MKRGNMIWMSTVRWEWAVPQVYFLGFLILSVIVHLIFLALDDAQRREGEVRECDGMDVDGETIVDSASGMFLLTFSY